MRRSYFLTLVAVAANLIPFPDSTLSLWPRALASENYGAGAPGKHEEKGAPPEKHEVQGALSLKNKKIYEIQNIFEETHKIEEIKDTSILKDYDAQLTEMINERMKWATAQIERSIPESIKQAGLTARSFSELKSGNTTKVNMGVLQSTDNLVRIGRMQPGGGSALPIDKQKTATLKDVFVANLAYSMDISAPFVAIERVKLLITKQEIKERYTNATVLQPIAIVELKYPGKIKMVHPFYYLTIEYDLEDGDLNPLVRFKNRIENQLGKLGEKIPEYPPHSVDVASTLNGDPKYYVK